MTCDEFKLEVAAYALGALDGADQQACEQHLTEAKHEGCVEALRAAAESATLLAEALMPASPSPSTWAAIEGRLRGTRQRERSGAESSSKAAGSISP